MGDEALSAEALFQRGREKQRVGNLGGAIADYTEAIRLKPGYAVAYLNRGKAYFGLYEHTEALRDFNRSIELNCEELHLAHLGRGDRKSTRLNSSHQLISYAVFCLKKKK